MHVNKDEMCANVRENSRREGVLFTRADTFGDSGATPGTSDPRFEVLSRPTGPNSFSFKDLTGDPGLLSLVLGPFKALPAN